VQQAAAAADNLCCACYRCRCLLIDKPLLQASHHPRYPTLCKLNSAVTYTLQPAPHATCKRKPATNSECDDKLDGCFGTC
jgi:hypothetical protein